MRAASQLTSACNGLANENSRAYRRTKSKNTIDVSCAGTGGLVEPPEKVLDLLNTNCTELRNRTSLYHH